MRRYIWLVCLVIFVLMSSGLALAQDNTQDVFCGSLSDDDCTLMGRSENFAMTSAKIDLNLDVTMMIDDGTQSFNMQASGAFVADSDIFVSLKDMQQPMTTFEQIKALVEILRGVDSELALNIT
ncbi:MAG: hypothetical protein IH587_10060, partial [Anaerolineae bacterium]|nr:hypothetical protein [Anaerolineae bacterium]